MAIKLNGNFDEGYALDEHTVSSKYIGEDAFGNKQFDTEYTQIGGLLYKMKYNGHHDTSLDILELAKPFLNEFVKNKQIDIVLPVPPSKNRDIQPVCILTELFAEYLKLPYSNGVLEKINAVQSKDGNKEVEIKLLKPAKRKCNVLLIDDLYSTGATINECVNVLKTDELVDKVYALTITKTGD